MISKQVFELLDIQLRFDSSFIYRGVMDSPYIGPKAKLRHDGVE